jgi:hypothetical protein
LGQRRHVEQSLRVAAQIYRQHVVGRRRMGNSATGLTSSPFLRSSFTRRRRWAEHARRGGLRKNSVEDFWWGTLGGSPLLQQGEAGLQSSGRAFDLQMGFSPGISRARC